MNSQTLTMDSWVSRRQQMVDAPMGEHLMMLSVEQGFYYDLNPTARLIWEALAEKRQIQAICTLVQREYEVTEGQCRESVFVFIRQLLSENMVQFCTGV